MATISFDIPNAQLARLVNAYCIEKGYTGDPDDQPARREFAREAIRNDMRETVRRVEMRQAYDAALRSSQAPIEPPDIS